MNWRRLYGLRSYLRSSLWVVPFIAIPFELVITRLAHGLDAWLGWNFLGFAVAGAQALLQATITATLSFVVFTFGSLLVAIQVASSQMTPRIIATTLLRNNVVRYTVGLFIFTFMFALSAQNRLEKDVHQFVILVAALLAILSFAAFFYLIDYASRLLRPISILAHVCEYGLAVIDSAYPDASRGLEIPASKGCSLGPSDRVIQHQGTSGIILAVNLEPLMAEAERASAIIEFVPQVGDFVAVDEPLFNLYGGSRSVDEEALRDAVAFGSERTLEQDPTFAFRIVIDIALRALSAAINDPTTAVLAIDQLHRMLRMVGNRHLRTDEIRNQSGELRVNFSHTELGGLRPPRIQRDSFMRFEESANRETVAGDDRQSCRDATHAMPSEPATAAKPARPRNCPEFCLSGRPCARTHCRLPRLGRPFRQKQSWGAPCAIGACSMDRPRLPAA
jgi:uncharacterized membrane protein